MSKQVIMDELSLLQVVLRGYPSSMARDDALRAVRNIIAKLEAQPAVAQGAGEVVTVTSKLGDLCSFHSTSVRKGDKLYTQPAAGADVQCDHVYMLFGDQQPRRRCYKCNELEPIDAAIAASGRQE